MVVTSKAVRVKTHKFHTVVAKLAECKMAINFHDMESGGNARTKVSKMTVPLSMLIFIV